MSGDGGGGAALEGDGAAVEDAPGEPVAAQIHGHGEGAAPRAAPSPEQRAIGVEVGEERLGLPWTGDVERGGTWRTEGEATEPANGEEGTVFTPCHPPDVAGTLPLDGSIEGAAPRRRGACCGVRRGLCGRVARTGGGPIRGVRGGGSRACGEERPHHRHPWGASMGPSCRVVTARGRSPRAGSGAARCRSRTR